mgnify:CR=1 FL=1
MPKIVLNKLRYSFPPSILQLLYSTLILPHLNYGILAWGNAAACYLEKVILLQKKAVRIINNVDYLVIFLENVYYRYPTCILITFVSLCTVLMRVKLLLFCKLCLIQITDITTTVQDNHHYLIYHCLDLCPHNEHFCLLAPKVGIPWKNL